MRVKETEDRQTGQERERWLEYEKQERRKWGKGEENGKTGRLLIKRNERRKVGLQEDFEERQRKTAEENQPKTEERIRNEGRRGYILSMLRGRTKGDEK